MEVGSLSEYLNQTNKAMLKFESHGNAPTITSEIARSGGKSMRVYLNRLTSSNSYRTELMPTGTTNWGHDFSLQWRKTYWVGFSIHVPSNWQTNSSGGEVLFQVHPRPDDWANSKTPMVCIRTSGNRWLIRVKYLTVPEAQSDISQSFTPISNTDNVIGIGKWTDWVMEYRPDWRLAADGGIGITRFWINGTKVVDYVGPNAYNETRGPYLNFGCYKSGWRDPNLADPVVERLYHFDEIRISRPDVGNYALVAPRAGPLPSAPILSVS
jgi:hypothetical protein